MDTIRNLNKPLITIGITCFNANDTIVRAVNSAIQQDWDNFEIIIVDDASDDESYNILKDRYDKNDEIVLIRHAYNKGFPSALNTIVNNAKGEYIAFFDDDDESRPDRLTKQYNYIIRHQNSTGINNIFCYSNRSVIKADTEAVTATVKAIGRDDRYPSGEMVSDFLLWHYAPPGYSWGQFGSCTLMIRRDVLKMNGGFDERFRRCAEWDMAIRASFNGAHFISVNEPLIKQYITPTADKAGRKPLKYALMLRNKHKKYLSSKHVYLASLAIAYSRFHYAKGNKIRSKIYLGAACMLAPHAVLPNEISKRLYNTLTI